MFLEYKFEVKINFNELCNIFNKKNLIKSLSFLLGYDFYS